jgi:hypothetical protein
MKARSYDDVIIKGKTRNLSNDEYDMLFEIVRNSDLESIQREIDNMNNQWLDGNSTYITISDESGSLRIGGHCAEHIDERFKDLMNYILGLLE